MTDCCSQHHGKKSALSTVPEGTLFTCPMHPEVLADRAGDCPKCGMPLEPLIPASGEDHESALIGRRTLIAVLLGLPLFVIAMTPMAGLQLIPEALSGWVELILSLPVLFWCGAPIWAKGLASFARRSLNMFSLIVLGTGAAFLQSVATLIVGHGSHGLYFEAASTIMVLVLLGQWLEARGRARAASSLRELLDLTPRRRSSSRRKATARFLLRHSAPVICSAFFPAKKFRQMAQSPRDGVRSMNRCSPVSRYPRKSRRGRGSRPGR